MPALTRGLLEKLHTPITTVLESSKRIFGQSLAGFAVKGSVIRGDFIPYYSDLDVHVFLHDDALIEGRAPRPEAALALQEVVGPFDLERLELSEVQLSFNSADIHPKGWSAAPPEVSRLIYGRLPEYDRHSESWREDASYVLQELGRERVYELRSVPDKADVALAKTVRRQGAFLKGGAYSLAGLLMNNIGKAQLLPYWELDDYLSSRTRGRVDLSEFHAYAERWKETRSRPAELRRMFQIGISQLQEIRDIRPEG